MFPPNFLASFVKNKKETILTGCAVLKRIGQEAPNPAYSFLSFSENVQVVDLLSFPLFGWKLIWKSYTPG